MKYIDADALIQQIEGKRAFVETELFSTLANTYSFALMLIRDAPAADVAPVVRCEDCSEKDYCGQKMRVLRGFDWTGRPLYKNVKVDYCSYGNRKDGTE